MDQNAPREDAITKPLKPARVALNVLALCFALSVLGRGLGDSFTVFLKPLSEDFGWDRAQAVSVYSLTWLAGGLTAPLVIRDRSAIPLSVDVDSPETVGLDRLLNAVAANALRPVSRASIVVDSGTATTLNFVSQDGVFCGGAILPGLEMSAKALHYYTAVLPLLPVQDLGGETPIAPGRNTREAIRNGLFWGQIGAIRELVLQICRQQGLRDPDFSGDSDPEDSPWMILTGGGGPVLSSQFTGFLALPSLGMHGLVLTAWKTGREQLPTTFPRREVK